MRYARSILVIVLCPFLSGCATISGVGSGLWGGLMGILGLTFKLLHGLADIAGKLPSF